MLSLVIKRNPQPFRATYFSASARSIGVSTKSRRSQPKLQESEVHVAKSGKSGCRICPSWKIRRKWTDFANHLFWFCYS